MSQDQRVNSNNCVGSNQSALNDSGRLDNCSAHTWQAHNSSSSSCLQSYECDCDDLSLTKNDTSSINVNASLRAVGQCCFNDANMYEFEIIDIQASLDSGHIMHPPDPCMKHDEQNLSSR